MSNFDSPEKPKRRVRYKGKNPTKFHEKYKEHSPENFSADMEKVIARGATPVGTHRSICVKEILEILQPKSGDRVLDATLGYGGHTSLILPLIAPLGILIGLDQDPIERPLTEARLRKNLIDQNSLRVGPINFSQTKKYFIENNLPPVDMILADLGLSSMQIDHPERGFSYKSNALLDLRMNPLQGEPAYELIRKSTQRELSEMLHENSDEIRSEIIAKALLEKKPKTSFELAETVRAVIQGFSKKVQLTEGDSPVRRAFQALRIAVNDEFKVLDQFLADIPFILKDGGRVAILSFHSGEDRRVKKSFQALERTQVYQKVSPEFIRPSAEEQRSNPRSKSAKLRWAIK